MAHAKRELREQARQLRRDGMSVREISTTLGIARSSASIWVRDILLTEDQIEALKERQRRAGGIKGSWGGRNKGAQTNYAKSKERRLIYQEEGRAKAREGRPLHLAGCMLYWAEGAKGKNVVYIVNSDPNMLLLFLRFLREELSVSGESVKIKIHCHDATQIARIEKYWLETLQLPSTCLGKTQVKKGSDTRRNILHNGVCGIAVYRTDLAMHIYGAIQEYGGFDNPAWLF